MGYTRSLPKKERYYFPFKGFIVKAHFVQRQ